METERESKKIKTPSGKELILKTYLTAGERNNLRRATLAGSKISAKDGQPTLQDFDPGFIDEAEKNIIELVVISYDGVKEKFYDILLKSKVGEYDFVLKSAEESIKSDFQLAK